MDDLISKLSEIRSEYNCFDENEEPYYRALSEAIKFLSRRADGDTVSREAVSEWLKQYGQDVLHGKYKFSLMYIWKNLMDLPSAQPEPISEEYAKAVRTWLINYQVRCAELNGRYTPYEILGWIVSDWRKENEIW